jgi:uncharacterized membrane protein
LIKVLAGLLVVAIAVFCVVFLAYFQEFQGNLSPKQEVWGQFGDFFGGTLNPFLSFLSLIALVFTVAKQSRQLELAHEELQNSKAELEATREELKRSADAQRLTAGALEEQAKYAVISAQLAALRASLEITSESVRQAQQAGLLAGPGTYQQLLQRKEAIAGEILRITEKLCKTS